MRMPYAIAGRMVAVALGAYLVACGSEYGVPRARSKLDDRGLPPTGAGGFTFGSTEDDTRRLCERAGHTYEDRTYQTAICLGLPTSIGVPARARLRYCLSRVCEVSLELEFPPGDANQFVSRWRDVVSHEYGSPTVVGPQVPARCNAYVAPCLIDGNPLALAEWVWSTGYRVTLSPAIDDARKAWLDITYSAADVKMAPRAYPAVGTPTP